MRILPLFAFAATLSAAQMDVDIVRPLEVSGLNGTTQYSPDVLLPELHGDQFGYFAAFTSGTLNIEFPTGGSTFAASLFQIALCFWLLDDNSAHVGDYFYIFWATPGQTATIPFQADYVSSYPAMIPLMPRYGDGAFSPIIRATIFSQAKDANITFTNLQGSWMYRVFSPDAPVPTPEPSTLLPLIVAAGFIARRYRQCK